MYNMPNNNLGFAMTIKSNNGTLVPLYPKTTKEQIIGWNAGEIYGPYQFTLTKNGWKNNQQTVALNGVTENDIVICTKVLSGTQSQMIAQEQAYGLLDILTGVESLQNQVRFTCTSPPAVDFTVQLTWTR